MAQIIYQQTLKHWLGRAGYRHSCFISWPSKSGPVVERLVVKLKRAIEENAPQHGLPPSVFIADDIPKGTLWKAKMSWALCESIAMIAILGPEYYESPWCGREWAGMLRLARVRLTRMERGILPLVTQRLPSGLTNGIIEVEILPPQVKRLNCLVLDASAIYLRTNYEKSAAFGKIVQKLTTRIYDISLQLFTQRSLAANCDKFALPQKSAFYLFKRTAQIYPMGRQP